MGFLRPMERVTRSRRSRAVTLCLIAGSATGAGVAIQPQPNCSERPSGKPVHMAGVVKPVAVTAAQIAAAQIAAEERREQSPAPSTTARVPVPPPPRVGRDLGTFLTSAYCLRGRTASGATAGPGSVAVDPSVIAPGTTLSIPGYGSGVADDTGGAIRGHRLDLWFSSCAAANEWGMRWVEVAG